MYTETTAIKNIIDNAHKIVIVQADNPDSDSLGSALALEQILGDMGKEPYLYCAVDVPGYLRYLEGWDRVQTDLPPKFDTSIIVDASTMTLLEKLVSSGQKGWMATKPCIVLDHHTMVDNPIDFAEITLNDPNRASTGELIYLISKEMGWPMPLRAGELIMTTILGDTQGLTNQLATAETYRIMAELVDSGVDRPKIEELRRELSKMPKEIYKYKAMLIDHSEFTNNDTIVSVTVSQVEINKYSPLYNPGPLIQNDILQTLGVKVAIVFKTYDDGKVTAAIRCNPSFGIAAELAEHFGGGGHTYASGFKVQSGRKFIDIKKECLELASELLAKLESGNTNETIQHTV